MGAGFYEFTEKGPTMKTIYDPDPYSLWARFESAGRSHAQAHTSADLRNIKFEMEL